MSYCRWSDEDYQCDVYVYHDCGGWWQTWVAGRKRRLREGVSFPPPIDVSLESDREAWASAYVERHRAIVGTIHEDNEGVLWDWVDLPVLNAGDSFRDATPGACADRLEEIRAAGFNVPQYAIDALRDEARAPTEQQQSEP